MRASIGLAPVERAHELLSFVPARLQEPTRQRQCLGVTDVVLEAVDPAVRVTRINRDDSEFVASSSSLCMSWRSRP